MSPRVYMLVHRDEPQVLPRAYGWGLQFRWSPGVEGLLCSESVIGKHNIVLGTRQGIRVAIDFPKKIDGEQAQWELKDLDRVLVKRVSIRAVLPKSELGNVLGTTNLTEEPIYVRARQVALELVESLFDQLARDSRVAPTLEAALPIGLCQVFYARQEFTVPRMLTPMVMYTAQPPRLTETSLPRFAREARRTFPLGLAWRLFRRARQLGEEEDSLSEAIVVATTALEVGLTRALVSKAASRSQSEKIRRAELAVLLGTIPPNSKKTDWSTLLLGASLKTAAPADFNVADGMRQERNQIVHDGTPPTSTWAEFRRQLDAVRRSLEWIEARL